MKTMWRTRLLVIGGIALAGAGMIGWALQPRPVDVDVAVAAAGTLVLTVDEEGETRLKEFYVVSAPVAGRIERIELEVGDLVVAGETVLARFIPSDPAIHDARSQSEAEAGVRTARADRAKAVAELDFAQAELRRAAELRRQGTISSAAFERAELIAKSARATLEQATAALAKRQVDSDSAKAALEPTRKGQSTGRVILVTSPISGRIMRRLQESETLVAAGSPLLDVGDTSQLEIVTDVLSADAVRIVEGADVVVGEWGGAQPLHGVVHRVEPFGFKKISALGIEEQRVNVITEFVSPREEWRALGHGYRVMTQIVIARKADVLTVPVGALFRDGEGWAVFTVSRSRASLTRVSVGLKTPLEAEVLKGLSAGDQVVVHPSDKVIDGVKVAARAVAPLR